jgi:hypothetical protein
MSNFLKILGSQTIQIVLNSDGKIISYHIETTGNNVDRIETISGSKNDASINVHIDLDRAIESFKDNSHFNVMNLFFILKQARNVNDIWNLLRLSAAFTIDIGDSYLKEKLLEIT